MRENDDIVEQLVDQGFRLVGEHNARAENADNQIILADTLEGQAAFVLTCLIGSDRPLVPPRPGETSRERRLEFLAVDGGLTRTLQRFSEKLIARYGAAFLTDAQIERITHLYVADWRRRTEAARKNRAFYRGAPVKRGHHNERA